MMHVIDSVQEIIAQMALEITVILVFFISLAYCKHLGQGSKAGKVERKIIFSSKSNHPPVLPKKVAARHGEEACDKKQLQVIKNGEIQMLQLLESREFTRALNVYRGFERDGRERHFSEALFSSLTQSAIRVGKIDVVERLLRSLKRHGIDVSLEFWRTTLKMLSSRKHFEACLSIYNLYGRTLPADKVVFSCLINGALENALPERAAAMLDRYCEADLDARDYVVVFRTYVATNDIQAAEKVFKKVGEDMTSLMLNLLLLICVNSKQPERALQLLHEARTLQDSRTSGMDESSPPVDPIVDVVSYNTVIKGFAQAGMLPECFECLKEMRLHNLEPDDVSFGTLLDTCIADNDMTAANRVVELLVHGDKPVDTVMCTLFIKGLVRAQRLPKAMELYEEMKRRNSSEAKPDIVTYSVLIKAFVDIHDLEQALVLVEDMATAGHSPDDIILTHLLEGCRYAGNHELGMKLFTDMMSAGVKPSDFTLITMLKLHGRCGAHAEAHQLVKDWERLHGMSPSVIHYTCLMSGCLRTKSYDHAWAAYKLMLEMKVQPDETTMATLVPGMLAAGQWDHVLALVMKALKGSSPIPIAGATLNGALSHMRDCPGQELQAMKLQSLMQEANIRIAPRNQRRPPPGL